ncbi:hypothetical protein K431DRAFT_306852 [Polychaeton citri CBS 116435]|uniref:histone acetyltransferase n=1 Tax=Polychaeton citri CBS 116435 TaxID=1314669 RepID=A0A9P4Q3M0_9PEZI|nr:hypothetical protein K431DRAFT_306852 [Polychaeton citri CBS 116435]
MSAATYGQQQRSLRDEFSSVLPEGFRCKVRHICTPSKRCDPLYSPIPGQQPEKTWLASHLLVVSTDYSRLVGNHGPAEDGKDDDVIVFAIEVFLYTTKHLTTIFVSKADSTGFLARSKPSPVKAVATTFLQWLLQQQLHKRPGRKIVLSLFGRAQNQYLFPGSADHGQKHVLDDRQLIKWWAHVLDPLFSTGAQHAERRGYITVPSYHGVETLRLFAPPGSFQGSSARWQSGHPLLELGQVRGLPPHAPARCLLPRFPDDPKARFISDLDDEVGLVEERKVTVSPSKRKSGRWTSIHDLDMFWEAMEFRQECSSGRVVGFIWLVISPESSDDASLVTAVTANGIGSPTTRKKSNGSCSHRNVKPSSIKRKKLSGPIIPRKPRLKGVGVSLSRDSDGSPHSWLSQPQQGVVLSRDGYDKSMQTLLNLDFGNRSVAQESTRKWVANVTSICGATADAWVMTVSGESIANQAEGLQDSRSSVNDLNGAIRKKRKAIDETANTVDSQSFSSAPTVNILASSMVRKKPKAS